jgi:hypothetical protein
MPLLGLAIAIGILVGIGAAWFLSSASRNGDKHRHESHANH